MDVDRVTEQAIRQRADDAAVDENGEERLVRALQRLPGLRQRGNLPRSDQRRLDLVGATLELEELGRDLASE